MNFSPCDRRIGDMRVRVDSNTIDRRQATVFFIALGRATFGYCEVADLTNLPSDLPCLAG